MKYKEIILSKYRRTSDSFCLSEPFAIYFIFAPEGNFIIKGMNKEVWEYANKHFSKFICQYTFWHKGKTRGGWRASLHLQLFINKKGKRFYVSMATKKEWKLNVMSFRRVPHRWLPEYNEALTKDEQNQQAYEQAADKMLSKYS